MQMVLQLNLIKTMELAINACVTGHVANRPGCGSYPVFINRSYFKKQLGVKKDVTTWRFVYGLWWYSETARNIQLIRNRLSTRFTQNAIYNLWVPDLNCQVRLI